MPAVLAQPVAAHPLAHTTAAPTETAIGTGGGGEGGGSGSGEGGGGEDGSMPFALGKALPYGSASLVSTNSLAAGSASATRSMTNLTGRIISMTRSSYACPACRYQSRRDGRPKEPTERRVHGMA